MSKPVGLGRRGSSGFTLVELLVAVSLLLLMATMALGSLSFGRRVWEARIEREARGDPEALRLLLRRQLMAAVPAVERRSDGARRLAFSGRPNSLEYLISEPGHTLPAGIYRVRIFADQDPASGQGRSMLRMKFTPLREYAKERAAAATVEELTLIGNLVGVRFRYYGAPRPEDKGGWFDEWPSDATLPRLIALELIRPAGDAAKVESIIVATKLAETR